MVVQGDRNVCRTNKSLLKNFPFSKFDIVRTLGQFNNSLNSDLPTKKYLDKLRSLQDLDIFSSVNPDRQIRSQYFSPHSFCKITNNLIIMCAASAVTLKIRGKCICWMN